MGPLTRRRALQLSGVGITAGLVGCLNGDSTTDTRLVELAGVNYTAGSRRLNVAVTLDGETRYSESVELDGTPDGADGFDASPFEGYPTTPGAYVVHGWHDGQSREEGETFDLGTIDHECVTVWCQIGSARPGRAGSDSDIVFTKSVGCLDDD